MSTSKRVGFIGLGNMGTPMAANLVRHGHDVMAYDIAADRARQFAQAHAAHATEDLAERHITLVDAPVSGGVPRATDGTLAIMIGGNSAAVAAVKPVLAAMGRNLFEVGGLGCGHAMKALNNFLAGTSYAAAVEAIVVGRQFGLDPTVMTDVINASTGRSFASENLIKQHVLSGKFATGFALALLAKDVRIAADLAREIGVDAPLGRLVSDLWGEARDAVGGEQDHTRAFGHWERRKRANSE